MLITIPKGIILIISDIAQRMKENIDYTRIVLYGSYANGTYNQHSDLDIAIFIKEDTTSIMEAYRNIQRICIRYDIDIQPQIFHEKEYQDPMGIVEEIVHNGIEISNFIYH